jgi:hypothetical protein
VTRSEDAWWPRRRMGTVEDSAETSRSPSRAEMIYACVVVLACRLVWVVNAQSKDYFIWKLFIGFGLGGWLDYTTVCK